MAKKYHRFRKEFDSKIELEFYTWLLSESFLFEYQRSFYISKTIEKDLTKPLVSSRKIPGKIITPDFEIFLNGVNIIVELKGFFSKHSVVNGKKKLIRHKYSEHIRYKYEILRRYFAENIMWDRKIFIIDQAHMPQFRKDLLNFRNGKIKLNEIINQY